MIYIDPSGTVLCYYGDTEDPDKKCKKNPEYYDEYKILDYVSEAKAYIPFHWITDIPDDPKKKGRNVWLKSGGESCCLKFKTDAIGNKWRKSLRWLMSKDKSKTDFTVHFQNLADVIRRKKFWFKTKNMNPVLRQYIWTFTGKIFHPKGRLQEEIW